MDTRVLSFDIGLRNLAFAELVVSHVPGAGALRLRRWGLLNLNPLGKKHCAPDEVLSELVAALDRTFASGGAAAFDYVLIENQPSRKNPTMKSIQVAVHTFFATLRQYAAPGAADRICLVGATQKLLCARAAPPSVPLPPPASPAAPPGELEDGWEDCAADAGDTDPGPKASQKSEYKARKDLSVDLAKLYVPALALCAKPPSARAAKAAAKRKADDAHGDTPAADTAAASDPAETSAASDPSASEGQGPASICHGADLDGVLGVYRAAKKRDDLCDALMQAVAYAEKHLLVPKKVRGGRAGAAARYSRRS